MILAGGGDDRIDGGRGRDIVVAGAGNDVIDDIDGGQGGDLLIGGTDQDKMRGGKGDDLMIAGSAANGDKIVSLAAELANWTSDDLAGALVDLGAISDDFDNDALKGEKGGDEVIGGPGDKLKP